MDLQYKRIEEIKVAIFLGGPSHEKNISLDSARTFFDSIRKAIDENNIILVFISHDLKFYELNHDWIFSNTIEDFEQQIIQTAEINLDHIIQNYDALCPLLHGKFGEDGELTKLFEVTGRQAFLGSSSISLSLTLNKAETINKLHDLGYKTVAYQLFNYADWQQDHTRIISKIRQQ